VAASAWPSRLLAATAARSHQPTASATAAGRVGPGGDQVCGDLPRLHPGQRGEHSPDARVQLLRLGRRQVGRGLPEQVVREPQPVGRTDQDPGPHRLIDERADVVPGRQHPAEHLRPDPRPAHRRDRDQLGARGGQPSQPPLQRVPHGPRRRRRGAEPGQLPDEERVAAGTPVQPRRQLGVGRLPGDRGDDRRHAGRVEPGQRQHGAAVGRRPRQLGVPVGAEQQHPCVPQVGGGELDQPQRRLVRPLQVVDDQDQRAARGQPGERRDHRLGQPEPRISRRHRRRRRRPLDQVGRRPQLGARGPGRPQQLDPRPVRRHRRPVPADRGQHQRPALAGLPGQLAEQRTLADARLAGDEHQPAVAGERRRQRGPGGAERVGAPLQRRHSTIVP
jgi:hypothetical protein